MSIEATAFIGPAYSAVPDADEILFTRAAFYLGNLPHKSQLATRVQCGKEFGLLLTPGVEGKPLTQDKYGMPLRAIPIVAALRAAREDRSKKEGYHWMLPVLIQALEKLKICPEPTFIHLMLYWH